MNESTLSTAASEAGDIAEIEEITVEEFYQRISQKNDILLLDVRNDRDFEAWKIESCHTPETMHIPYIIFAEDGPEALEELPQLTAVPADREIVSSMRVPPRSLQPASSNRPAAARPSLTHEA